MKNIEIWKPIKGFEGFYEISNFGKVKRICTKIGKPCNKLLGESPDKSGYIHYSICKNGKVVTKTAASLVMENFVAPRPKNVQVNHKNGNKRDNRPENLEYISRTENIRHARDVLKVKHGHPGEDHIFAKLNDKKVREIRNTKNYFGLNSFFAKKFGISNSLVSLIKLNKSWTHI